MYHWNSLLACGSHAIDRSHLNWYWLDAIHQIRNDTHIYKGFSFHHRLLSFVYLLWEIIHHRFYLQWKFQPFCCKWQPLVSECFWLLINFWSITCHRGHMFLLLLLQVKQTEENWLSDWYTDNWKFYERCTRFGWLFRSMLAKLW